LRSGYQIGGGHPDSGSHPGGAFFGRRQQALDLGPETAIAGTGGIEEAGPLLRGKLDGVIEELTEFLPSFRCHRLFSSGYQSPIEEK
jgi:hypothetical protein